MRVKQAKVGATASASFTYDAYGRRIQSSIAQQGQAAQTVQYLENWGQIKITTIQKIP